MGGKYDGGCGEWKEIARGDEGVISIQSPKSLLLEKQSKGSGDRQKYMVVLKPKKNSNMHWRASRCVKVSKALLSFEGNTKRDELLICSDMIAFEIHCIATKPQVASHTK